MKSLHSKIEKVSCFSNTLYYIKVESKSETQHSQCWIQTGGHEEALYTNLFIRLLFADVQT